jgi:tetratricopeptide (TPR) repeat protein
MPVPRAATALSVLVLAAALAPDARADGASLTLGGSASGKAAPGGVSGTAAATATGGAAAAPAATASPPPVAPGDIRRDPRGIKGISPLWEAIKRGDDAVAARDADAAKAAYEEAIRADPHAGIGQYRMGELQLAKGQMKEAEASWQEALRFSAEDPSLRAKVLFVLADLKERQRSLEEATNGWNAYEAHAKAQPTAKTFPATAEDRKKRIQEWKQLEADYSAVKERIKKRLEEADKKAAESALSPHNR